MNREALHRAVPLLAFSTALLLSSTSAAGLFATVRDVIDGDTIVLGDGRKVRYLGINAPERNQPFYREATTLNRRLVSGLSVRLEFDQARQDRHGRLLAYVYLKDKMVNEWLLAEGLAHVVSIPPNTRYAHRFLQTQEKARTDRKGMWKIVRGPMKITRIEPHGDGEEGKDALSEFVRIANISSEIGDIGGYSISDRDGHRYDFPVARIRPGYTLTLVTGGGEDQRDQAGPIRLYWNRRSPVWNDREDTATLRDATGKVVDIFEYRTGTRRERPQRGD